MKPIPQRGQVIKDGIHLITVTLVLHDDELIIGHDLNGSRMIPFNEYQEMHYELFEGTGEHAYVRRGS